MACTKKVNQMMILSYSIPPELEVIILNFLLSLLFLPLYQLLQLVYERTSQAYLLVIDRLLGGC